MWGKIRQDFRKFLPKQSMQNILYVIILTLTLLVSPGCRRAREGRLC